jgi:hypothetical protein
MTDDTVVVLLSSYEATKQTKALRPWPNLSVSPIRLR